MAELRNDVRDALARGFILPAPAEFCQHADEAALVVASAGWVGARRCFRCSLGYARDLPAG
jgi:hypothetical protein